MSLLILFHTWKWKRVWRVKEISQILRIWATCKKAVLDYDRAFCTLSNFFPKHYSRCLDQTGQTVVSQIQQLLHTVIIFTHEKHAQGSLSAFSLSLLNFIVEGDKDKNLGEIQLCKMSLFWQIRIPFSSIVVVFFFFRWSRNLKIISKPEHGNKKKQTLVHLDKKRKQAFYFWNQLFIVISQVNNWKHI